MEYAMPILSISNFNGNGIDDGRSKLLPISNALQNLQHKMIGLWCGQCKKQLQKQKQRFISLDATATTCMAITNCKCIVSVLVSVIIPQALPRLDNLLF